MTIKINKRITNQSPALTLNLQNVPDWLFTLAFSLDPLTKYYACLAICALVSNKQFEAAVLKSGTLGLVDPFVATHDPVEFALLDDLHHGDGRKGCGLKGGDRFHCNATGLGSASAT